MLSSADPVTGHVDDVASVSCVTSCSGSNKGPKDAAQAKRSNFEHSSM